MAGGWTRRELLGLAGAGCVAIAVGWSDTVSAEEGTIPIKLQVGLLQRLVGYERNVMAAVKSRVRVGIAFAPGDAASESYMRQVKQALADEPLVGGMPHDESEIPFDSVQGIVGRIRSKGFHVVYFCPGTTEQLHKIGEGLDGAMVITVAGTARDVSNGAVLGFDLVSGRPKLCIHLTRAKRQNLSFKADVLRLMKVFE